MKDEFDNATPDLLGMHRHDDHQTSVNAAGKVRRFTIREEVEQFAKDSQTEGFIDDDLKRYWPNKPESSFRKRRTELAQENIIVDTGMTRVNRAGMHEKVWFHRDFHPSPPPIIDRDTTPKQSRLARLEATVQELLAALKPFGDLNNGLPNEADMIRAERAYKRYSNT